MTGTRIIKTKIGGQVIQKNTEDGKYVATIECIKLEVDKLVNIKGVHRKRDVLEFTFKLAKGIRLKKNFFYDLSVGSPVIDLVEIINGEIPEYINDLEELIVEKKLIIEVKNNKVEDKVYSNIVAFYPIDRLEDFGLFDDIKVNERKTPISALFDNVDEE